MRFWADHSLLTVMCSRSRFVDLSALIILILNPDSYSVGMKAWQNYG
uniref:Uncharacterized protein n=1 Tax=Triticum urartu TaxID=4572 RepID=A0A8R7QLG7_TRIUA